MISECEINNIQKFINQEHKAVYKRRTSTKKSFLKKTDFQEEISEVFKIKFLIIFRNSISLIITYFFIILQEVFYSRSFLKKAFLTAKFQEVSDNNEALK